MRRLSSIAAFLPMLALVYLFVSLHRLAPRKPGYRHLLHTISELGEIGAPDQRFVAWGLFLPIGLAFVPGALLFGSSAPVIATLSVCIAIGYILAAAFPCDPGSPVSGSVRQAIHNVGGAIQYIGGGFALLEAARSFGAPARVGGFVVLAVAVALTILPSAAARGLVQRIGEIVLFGSATWWMWISASGN